MTRGRMFGLQARVVGGLLVIAAVPLVVSAVLIGSIAEVAQNFASNETDRLAPALTRAQAAYRELVSARKSVFNEVAHRLTARVSVPVDDGGAVDVLATQRRLGALLGADEQLTRAALLDADARLVAEALSTRLPGDASGRWRDFTVVHPVGSIDRASGTGGAASDAVVAGDPGDDAAGNADAGGNYALSLTFVTRVDFLDDYESLGRVLEESARMTRLRAELPDSYRTAFLILVGGVVVAVTGAGIAFARRLTSRIENLAAATRDVAAGHLDARVVGGGSDELGELAESFNIMVAQLERDRSHIEYLHKIGAWQDVARKLAHEIKNPLTPIQLAVQQAVSMYDGSDERYAGTLKDTQEIVVEEIDNLKRLLDAFRSLGALPQAELEDLDLATVVDDLVRDPVVRDRLRLTPPAHPVLVRADRLLLRRVLANLVENGMHAGQGAGREGAVRVSWRADGGNAVIDVDDEGDGVAPAVRVHMFDPYVTTKEQGSGLGLAISKKIVLDHRGSLEIAPKPAPSGGARMVVTLPLA